MELDQEKQNQEAAERCRALAQRIVRELAPRSVQVLEDSGLLEKAFCKMNTAVVQSAPELLVVADPQWVSLPAVQAEKVLLVCGEYAGMADCAKQLAAQGFAGVPGIRRLKFRRMRDFCFEFFLGQITAMSLSKR